MMFGVFGEKSVSTHSRPKAAGSGGGACPADVSVFQHTAARRRLATQDQFTRIMAMFQHTAARRRLAMPVGGVGAGAGFNTQPPEGGWKGRSLMTRMRTCFNTQPPEGGWIVVI